MTTALNLYPRNCTYSLPAAARLLLDMKWVESHRAYLSLSVASRGEMKNG